MPPAAIVAGTTYDIEVEYNATSMVLKVDNTTRITITQTVNFSTVPTIVYWGSKQDGTCQEDATAAAPL